jgi:hypothetical protein
LDVKLGDETGDVAGIAPGRLIAARSFMASSAAAGATSTRMPGLQ